MPIIGQLISLDKQKEKAVETAHKAIIQYIHNQLNGDGPASSNGAMHYKHIVDQASGEVVGRKYYPAESKRLVTLFDQEYKQLLEIQKKFTKLKEIAKFFEQQLFIIQSENNYTLDAHLPSPKEQKHELVPVKKSQQLPPQIERGELKEIKRERQLSKFSVINEESSCIEFDSVNQYGKIELRYIELETKDFSSLLQFLTIQNKVVDISLYELTVESDDLAEELMEKIIAIGCKKEGIQAFEVYINPATFQ